MMVGNDYPRQPDRLIRANASDGSVAVSAGGYYEIITETGYSRRPFLEWIKPPAARQPIQEGNDH